MPAPKTSPSRQPVPDCGSGLLAWALILMALGAYTPCVLLPEWRTYQALRNAEQVGQHRVDSLEQVVERERRRFEATRDDPEVLARLAQRELGFRRSDERPVVVSVPVAAPRGEEPFIPQPIRPPPFLARAAVHLPDYDYDAVFCDRRTRGVIIAMSVALIGVALWLPGRRSL